MTTTLSPSKLAYTIPQAAEATGVSERHLRDIINAGHLAVVTPRGTSKRLIMREELESWLSSGE